MRKFMRSNFSAFILASALIAFSSVPAFAADSVEYVERSVDANGNVVSQTIQCRHNILSHMNIAPICTEAMNEDTFFA